MIKNASFSADRKFRFSLWRIWDISKPTVMFIGLNPSTANEQGDDNTIRRVIDFARRWGYGGVYMLNCFPLVSKNPKDLIGVDQTGEMVDNENHLDEHGRECKDVIFAWGNFDIVKQTKTDIKLVKMFPLAKCLGKNKNGSPKHPLYIKGDTVPILFKAPTCTHPVYTTADHMSRSKCVLCGEPMQL